jgi:hypothetical protein
VADASAAIRPGFDIPVRIHLELPAAAELAAKNNTGKAPKTLRRGKRSQIRRDAAGLPTQRRERCADEAWSPPPPASTAGEGSDLSVLGTWTDRFGCLVLLFTSLFAIPLACQRLFYATLFARLQIEGMTFHFLNDVFLLNLAFKPAQCIFKRLAFLNANLRQRTTPPNRPTMGNYQSTGIGH